MRKVKEKWTLKRVLKEIITTLILFFIISQVMNFIRKPEITTDIYTYNLRDIENEEVEFLEYIEEPLIVHF
jgi:hypothetical protein